MLTNPAYCPRLLRRWALITDARANDLTAATFPRLNLAILGAVNPHAGVNTRWRGSKECEPGKLKPPAEQPPGHSQGDGEAHRARNKTPNGANVTQYAPPPWLNRGEECFSVNVVYALVLFENRVVETSDTRDLNLQGYALEHAEQRGIVGRGGTVRTDVVALRHTPDSSSHSAILRDATPRRVVHKRRTVDELLRDRHDGFVLAFSGANEKSGPDGIDVADPSVDVCDLFRHDV